VIDIDLMEHNYPPAVLSALGIWSRQVRSLVHTDLQIQSGSIRDSAITISIGPTYARLLNKTVLHQQNPQQSAPLR